MNWSCPICPRPQKASPKVEGIIHIHNGKEYRLEPYKKTRKERGVDTVKSLKVEVWDLFSEWVRRSEADENGICTCVTCGHRDTWRKFDCGHYIHGTLFRIRELCHTQCRNCNGFKAGMAIEYREYMLKEYGKSMVDRLTFLAKRPHKFTVFELQKYRELYQEKLAILSGEDRKQDINLENLPF